MITPALPAYMLTYPTVFAVGDQYQIFMPFSDEVIVWVKVGEHLGSRLNFRCGISTAGPLAYGTAQETEQVCRETLETMMAVRGYHFAPTHAIQDNSPTENVLAMYAAAHKYGRY